MHKVLLFSNGRFQAFITFDRREDVQAFEEAIKKLSTKDWIYQTIAIMQEGKP